MTSGTETTELKPADGRQNEVRTGNVLVHALGFVLIWAVWLLALVLTEWLEGTVQPLDASAFTAVYVVVVMVLLVAAAFLVHMIDKTIGIKFAAPTPMVLQRGYVGLRRWATRSKRRALAYVAVIALLFGIVASQSFKLARYFHDGSDLLFYQILITITSVFGLGVILLLGASLTVGLLAPRRPRA